MAATMSDQYNLSSVMIVRRQPKKLPSIRRHLFRAFLIFCLTIGVAAAGIWMYSNPNDAEPIGEVTLDPPPLPDEYGSLNDDAGTLPDLLMDVPLGANPTAVSGPAESLTPVGTVDALGNPIGGARESSLAGAQPRTTIIETPRPAASSSGPKMILIDGKPIDGATPRSPLLKAPFPGLSRPTAFGNAPKPASDGRKAVTAYARSFTPASGKNSVALIIGGLGIDSVMTFRAINELPPEVTLSFAAHTSGLQDWINKARAAGHEVLIELPMEYEGFDASEPGAEYALKTTISASRNIRNLDRMMSQGLGYFGVINYNGDVLTKRADVLAPIMTHLSDAGLGFIFDGSHAAPTLPALAASVNLPFKQAYTLLDTINEPAIIETELTRLEAQATSGRTPIGVGFSYANTIDQVKTWSSGLSDKGLELAPASYALNRNR